MVGWQRHLQSLVTQVAKRYDCSHSASFSTFSQAKASLVSGGISSLPGLRNLLNPTMSRSPFLHMQKKEFTSSRILLAAEGVKQRSRSSKVASPKNTKFPKHFKGRIHGVASKGVRISFGEYALQALEPAWITERQIEAGRRAIVRDARGGKIWVRLIPDKPVTRKPAETRMGRGKGNPAFRVAGVQAGRILYEVGGVSEAIAKRAFTLAASKMPINTRFISLR